MTSLNAQHLFGAPIDASQLQPVTVTRRDQPVAVVLSYEVAKIISERFPLRGPEAVESVRQHLAKMSNCAAEEGLTEDDVARLLQDE